MFTMESNPRTIYDLAETAHHTVSRMLWADPKVIKATNVSLREPMFRLAPEIEDLFLNDPVMVEDFENHRVFDRTERLGLLYYWLACNYTTITYDISIEDAPAGIYDDERDNPVIAQIAESVDYFHDVHYGVYYQFDDVASGNQLDLPAMLLNPHHPKSTGQPLNFTFPGELYLPLTGTAAAVVTWLEETYKAALSANTSVCCASIKSYKDEVYNQIVYEYLTCGGYLKLLVE